MQTIQFALLLVFPALVVVAALKDATSYTIPNWISLALIAAFAPVALISGASLGPIGLCLAAGVGALVLGMGMFAAGWIGGGDAKLFAVCEPVAGLARHPALPDLTPAWPAAP
jgi:prepilin peptidase CpaA